MASTHLCVLALSAGLALLSAGVGGSGISNAQSNPADQENLRQAATVIQQSVTRMWVRVRPVQPPSVGPRIRINLNRDGTLNGVPEIENPSDDPQFAAYAESAIRAVLRAAPFDLAPYSDSYEQWKSVVLPFQGATQASAGTAATNRAEPKTTANFSPAYKANGNEIHSLTLYKELADGSPVLALAFCGAGDIEGSFALGVDFGQGSVWREPEKVNVAFGTYQKDHTMQVMREYLGFEGVEAKAVIADLVKASGQLTFSGPRGLSVSFDLDGAKAELAQLKQYCDI